MNYFFQFGGRIQERYCKYFIKKKYCFLSNDFYNSQQSQPPISKEDEFNCIFKCRRREIMIVVHKLITKQYLNGFSFCSPRLQDKPNQSLH